MKASQRLSGMGFIAAMGLLGGTTFAVQETATFDTGPEDWVAVDIDGDETYGFSNTNNAGGTAGEVGGIFSRETDTSYFHDITLGGGFGMAGPAGQADGNVDFSGLFDITDVNNANNSARIGYTDSAETVRQSDFMGIALTDLSPTSLRFRVHFQGESNTDESRLFGNDIEIGLNQNRRFEFSYDPDGGAGFGQMTATAFADTDSDGQLDDVLGVSTAAFSESLRADEIQFNAFGLNNSASGDNPPETQTLTAFIDNLAYDTVPTTLLGDFNADAKVDATDIDLLCDRINAGTGSIAPFDVNGDGSVNNADVNFEVTSILDTKFGDTDTDGDVDLNDLGNLASGFNVPGEKRWSRGNFDCDLDVDLNDLGTLATNFGAGRAAAMAAFEALVPEPSALALAGLGALGMCRRSRR